MTTTTIIAYRTPLDQWFWEGGWQFVLTGILLLFFISTTITFVVDYLDKRKQKKRWRSLTERQKADKRYFKRCNNFPLEPWEKEV